MLDGISDHQPARAFGIEADDLVAAALEFLKYATHHARFQRLTVHGLEILLAGQVDDNRRDVGRGTQVQVFGNSRAPEAVQVGSLLRHQRGTHLKPVGLHPVERAKHAIQPAQDTHMILGPAQLRLAEGSGIKPAIHIPVKGEHGLPRIFPGKTRRPRLVTRHIQRSQGVRKLHQRSYLCRRFGLQHPHQLSRLACKQRLGMRRNMRRGVVVERLGR